MRVERRDEKRRGRGGGMSNERKGLPTTSRQGGASSRQKRGDSTGKKLGRLKNYYDTTGVRSPSDVFGHKYTPPIRPYRRRIQRGKRQGEALLENACGRCRNNIRRQTT